MFSELDDELICLASTHAHNQIKLINELRCVAQHGFYIRDREEKRIILCIIKRDATSEQRRAER